MSRFSMNGDGWQVRMVDGGSAALIDRTGRLRLATTDPDTLTICLSSDLRGSMAERVLIHEMGHAAMVSYGLLEELHSFVPPDRWIEAEEWVCNFLADYGGAVMRSARKVLGSNAIYTVPDAIGRLVA